MGIESAVIAIGSMGGFFSGVTAAVIGSAIVGAAIGGLTAAIMGGDIGQGLLFGAIGGAVLGGISGVGSTIAESAGSAGLTGSANLGISESYLTAAGDFATSAGTSISTSGFTSLTAPSILESVGAQIGVSALTEGVKGYIAADAQDEALKAQEESKANEYEKLLELQELKGKQTMEQIQYQRDNASAAEKLANEARLSELNQRKEEFASTLGFQREQYDATQQSKEERQALFSADTRRGGTVEDGTNVGIYSTLQDQGQGALLNPAEDKLKAA